MSTILSTTEISRCVRHRKKIIHTLFWAYICGCCWCHCRCHCDYNRWNLDAIINGTLASLSCSLVLFFGWLTWWSHFVCGLAIRLSVLHMQNSHGMHNTFTNFTSNCISHLVHAGFRRAENRWRAHVNRPIWLHDHTHVWAVYTCKALKFHLIWIWVCMYTPLN